MEYLGWLGVGFTIGVWTTILLGRYMVSHVDHGGAKPVNLTPGGLLRPFTKSAKKTPKVNNDQKAWMMENEREV